MDLILNVMNDFQTVNDIVNESVRNSSYYTVAISSCVFILYTLIVQLIGYFKGKAKNKPIMEMSKALSEMGENIVKLNAVLDKTLKDAERKEVHKCKKAIELGFGNLESVIVKEVQSIIIHNNIVANKGLITDNLRTLVSTEYYKLYSTLSDYEINEISVNRRLKEEWIKELSDEILKIIYNDNNQITRISQINNRVATLIANYSTYINNKTFNT